MLPTHGDYDQLVMISFGHSSSAAQIRMQILRAGPHVALGFLHPQELLGKHLPGIAKFMLVHQDLVMENHQARRKECRRVVLLWYTDTAQRFLMVGQLSHRFGIFADSSTCAPSIKARI
jgi:hypothetical protein